MVKSGVRGATTWARQLRKGVLDLAILAHLRKKPVYGYALIQQLKGEGLMAAGGAEATAYQALQRLAKAGLAKAKWSAPGPSDRPRKVYSITPEGEVQYHDMTAEWRALRDAVDALQEDE